MQFNVTAVWHHRTSAGRDAAGNTVTSMVDTEWPCVYDPGSSSETDTGETDTVSTSPRLIGQPGNPVPGAGDAFTVPVGGLDLEFEVDGDPDVYPSPFPSGQAKIGPVVALSRVTG